MGTRVAVMQHGVLEQVGPPQEVYDRPASLFVAQFLGTPPMNVFQPGMLEPGDRSGRCAARAHPARPGGPADRPGVAGRSARLRAAHHLRAAERGAGRGPHQRRWTGHAKARRCSSTPSPGTGTTSTRSPASGWSAEVSRSRDAGRRCWPCCSCCRPWSCSACSSSTRSARTIWLGLYRGGGFSGAKTYVGWSQYWDVFQSNEFRHSLGVTFAVRADHRAGRPGHRPRAGGARRQAPARHALLPHRVLLDRRDLGRRGLADLARAAATPDRRAHQHPARSRC